jgi:hypothetical protein
MKREIQYVVKHFREIRDKFNNISESDDDSNLRYSGEGRNLVVPNLNGTNLLWRTTDVFWVNAYQHVESYDASAMQLGITKDGKLVREYQSHCSCNGWSNSELKDVTEFSSFKELMDWLDMNYEREAITDGEIRTHLSDIEPKFYETLKGLISALKNTSNREAKQ